MEILLIYPNFIEERVHEEDVRVVPIGLYYIGALLKEHGIRRYFDFVAGGDSFQAKKPDPCAIHFLMERYRFLPSDILVVGDHEPDIQMAKNAKAQSVFCTYGFFGKDKVGADYEIDSFPELLKILDQIDG